MTLASGILFVTPKKSALFLKRGAGGDHPGEWCFPGGHLEDGETLEECAAREAVEECGKVPKGDRLLWTRTVTQPQPSAPIPETGAALAPVSGIDVDFTTFLQKVDEEFTPTLDGEHVGYAWAPVDQPPQPLHPGADVALSRFTMDELGIAQAIRDGRLTSPQQYENVWLFAIRITGTGAAYRHRHDEFVWRDPAIYMNEEFLQRCNGLPVIMEHPKKAVLDTQEFTRRIVGTVVLPYLKPKANEVWGIAKIYDAPTAEMMRGRQLSTSPSVVFRDPSVNNKVELENGSKLLIEGKPSLLDHVAICEQGVWDKGGEPRGVLTASNGEVRMDDDEKRVAEDKARKDAEEREKADAAAGEKLDKLLTGLDSIGERMDTFSKRMDAVEAKADAAFEKKADAVRKDEPAEREEMAEKMKAKEKKPDAKKDAEEEEKEKGEKAKEVVADKRKDGEEEEKEKKADSATGTVSKADLEAIRRMIPRHSGDTDFADFAKVQERADHVFSAFGDSASRPMQGEGLLEYRKRLASKLKDHSPVWKGVDLAKIADDAALCVMEDQIYADAVRAADRPVNLPAGQFQERVRTDATGRRIVSFVGTGSFVRGFKQPTRRVARLNTQVRDR